VGRCAPAARPARERVGGPAGTARGRSAGRLRQPRRHREPGRPRGQLRRQLQRRSRHARLAGRRHPRRSPPHAQAAGAPGPGRPVRGRRHHARRAGARARGPGGVLVGPRQVPDEAREGHDDGLRVRDRVPGRQARRGAERGAGLPARRRLGQRGLVGLGPGQHHVRRGVHRARQHEPARGQGLDLRRPVRH